ncbi:MAG: alanine--tRNA ligase [Bacillota bacterium]
MKVLTGSQVRQMWLTFFAEKGHQIIEGKSLVPFQDPTLLWINSGVAALKKYFDGTEIPQNKRLTNAQKSLRTNDIEQVGYTARHHTFFEMLGNFSIGDYFRKEAITWAFELLTSAKWFGFEIEKLYMTYSPLDHETPKIWQSLGIPADHLFAIEGNFWEIGEGPCGPNTEIFYDRGPKYDQKGLGVRLLKEEISNDRYIEIWNIVFSQFNAITGVSRDKYKELPSKNIDTGAGLERLVSIFQSTPTNFETDLFFPIIKATEKLASISYEKSEFRPYRVIADHIRTLTFALSDGAIFSNEGRGYVLRRILRRAVRYGKKIGINKPFLTTLIPVVLSIMSKDYPYLQLHQSTVTKMILQEEEKFLSTLQHGESLLKQYLDQKKPITGEIAFKLYDTFGFPVELTKEIAEEHQLSVDMAGFENLMENQRERARQARQMVGSMAKQSADLLAFKQESRFMDDGKTIQGKVIGIFKDGIQKTTLEDEGEIILHQTNFYAESGGQTSDLGTMSNMNSQLDVIDVQKAPHKQHLHKVQVRFGVIKVGDILTLEINRQRRQIIRQHHSSLHLLQAALKKHLGSHILQQGSFVGDQYARFDFSHPQKITEQELAMIEQDVNDQIAEAANCLIEFMPIDQAKKTGAIAPFEEKYGDIVRIVTLGPRSKEFCGGTHVNNTQEIGMFIITSEESIAAGTRRLVVVAGAPAYAVYTQKERMMRALRDQIKAGSTKEIADRLKALLIEKDNLKESLSIAQESQAEQTFTSLSKQLKLKPFLHGIFYESSLTRPILMKVIDRLKSVYPESFLILIGKENESYPIGSYVGASLRNTQRNAAIVTKSIAQLMHGSGGGKPDLAFGAGKDMIDLQILIKTWIL